MSGSTASPLDGVPRPDLARVQLYRDEARVDAGRDEAVAEVSGVHELADCCRWVADAHDARDPQQLAAALCAMYRVLASRGWTPPARSSILLHLHPRVVDAELAQMVERASPSV